MKNRSGDREAVQIRTTLKPGDIGYITYLHGVLYAREYRLDCTLDGYVAESLARFVLSFDAKKDCLWLAEEQGQIVGSIGVVGESDSTAQLRWFIVHPAKRGSGLGRRLLGDAIDFCNKRGFKSVFLWTFSELKTAAHLYLSAGFRKTDEKTHQVWGRLLTEERYELLCRDTLARR